MVCSLRKGSGDGCSLRSPARYRDRCAHLDFQQELRCQKISLRSLRVELGEALPDCDGAGCARLRWALRPPSAAVAALCLAWRCRGAEGIGEGLCSGGASASRSGGLHSRYLLQGRRSRLAVLACIKRGRDAVSRLEATHDCTQLDSPFSILRWLRLNVYRIYRGIGRTRLCQC